MATALYNKGTTSGAKAQNAEWFGTDISPGIQSGKAINLIIQVSVSTTAVDLEVTLDGGTTWAGLNGGTAIPVNQLHAFDVLAKQGDTVNFRAANVGGTTVDYCYIVGDLDG